MANHGDPEVGDSVILRDKILSIDEGVAVVDVYRSSPLGLRVPVQCGALDYDETADSEDDCVPAVSTEVDEAALLRAAIQYCTSIVRACMPPRLSVLVSGQEVPLALGGHVHLVRADMIVMRGNMIHVLVGPTEETWTNALRRWSEWPSLAKSFRGEVFLACVRVRPWATAIMDSDIFTAPRPA